MKYFKVEQFKQQLVLSICLVVLIFLISANSGNYYSDDFPLFLALLGLTGLYLEPLYTKIQSVLIVIALVVLYILHPEKADPLPQYGMCVAMLAFAAFINYLVIKRGRAFIEMSVQKAKEAETFLNSIQLMGGELEESHNNSTARLEALKAADSRLNENISTLKTGSSEIYHSSTDIRDTCFDVHQQMQLTGSGIEALNAEVKQVEDSLNGSKNNMSEMHEQMRIVNDAIKNTDTVFEILSEQIRHVTSLAKELSEISSSTKMIALNASIEAARAGKAGEGFAVVATEVQNLATHSNTCSVQVANVVEDLQNQITKTTSQLSESLGAITSSLEVLGTLERGFDDLTLLFNSLYKNINEQNSSITSIDSMFDQLNDKITTMSTYSAKNQEAVNSILEAVSAYQTNIKKVVDDTEQLHQLSSSMLNSVK